MSSSGPVPPPPKPPKPGKILVYKALYSYTAQNEDELSFDEEDILYVSDNSSNSGWWTGTCKGVSGLIPYNYVSESAEYIENPLHEVTKRGNLDLMKDCLSNRVSVNSLDKSGSTAVYWASHGGHADALRLLLSVPSVNLAAINKLGDSALHACAWKGHLECARILLESGCNPNVKNREGKTALEISSNPEVSALIKRYVTTTIPNNDDEYFDDSD